MNQTIERCVKAIERHYNPERDVIDGEPNVNWADAYLLEIVKELAAEVDQLKAKVAELEGDVHPLTLPDDGLR